MVFFSAWNPGHQTFEHEKWQTLPFKKHGPTLRRMLVRLPEEIHLEHLRDQTCHAFETLCLILRIRPSTRAMEGPRIEEVGL